jgi:hypothetical protein
MSAPSPLVAGGRYGAGILELSVGPQRTEGRAQQDGRFEWTELPIRASGRDFAAQSMFPVRGAF